jgi:hypothetical protein
MLKNKFSKKLLGKKLRTVMTMHRISLKIYKNGIVIKPIWNQGLSSKICPKQEAMFLTNENARHLLYFLSFLDTANKILDSLEDKNETH